MIFSISESGGKIGVSRFVWSKIFRLAHLHDEDDIGLIALAYLGGEMVQVLDSAQGWRIGEADYPTVLEGDTLDLDEYLSPLGFKIEIEARVSHGELGTNEARRAEIAIGSNPFAYHLIWSLAIHIDEKTSLLNRYKIVFSFPLGVIRHLEIDGGAIHQKLAASTRVFYVAYLFFAVGGLICLDIIPYRFDSLGLIWDIVFYKI